MKNKNSKSLKARFYISPFSGRAIKSSGKLFTQLKKDGYIIDKHRCFYNVKSAERCLNRLMKLYPDIAYPPSNLINIPKTYKKGKARSFIYDKKRE